MSTPETITWGPWEDNSSSTGEGWYCETDNEGDALIAIYIDLAVDDVRMRARPSHRITIDKFTGRYDADGRAIYDSWTSFVAPASRSVEDVKAEAIRYANEIIN